MARQQQIELLTAIDGRAEIPVKFHYLGPDCWKNWDEVSASRLKAKHNIESNEAALLSSRLNEILSVLPKIDKLNIIDVGCGNAAPIIPVLKALKERGVNLRYVPLYISKKLLELAEKNAVKAVPGLKTKCIEFDFERGNFADFIFDLKLGGWSNLIAFLGGTVGNSQEPARTLANFRDSMGSSDFMLIGCELVDVIRLDRVLSLYTEEHLGNFVYSIPGLIGIKRDNVIRKQSFNEKLSRVEIHLTIKKGAAVAIGDQKLTLEAGETLLALISKRFTELTFTQLMHDVGFRAALTTTPPDGSYILSLMQPVRHKF